MSWAKCVRKTEKCLVVCKESVDLSSVYARKKSIVVGCVMCERRVLMSLLRVCKQKIVTVVLVQERTVLGHKSVYLCVRNKVRL